MSKLEVDVGIRNGPFKNGLDQMRAQAQSWGNDIKSTLAGAFALSAVSSFFTGFMSNMARVKDLSDRLGESTDTIQRVGNAAKLSGSDLEGIIKVLSKLTLETGKSAEKFAAVGISAAEFANADTEGKIMLLARAYEAANGNQEKMLALMELLGPKGQDTLILLSQGVDELNKQLANVPIVSETAVAAMARLDDAIDASKQTMAQWAGKAVDLFQKAAMGFAAIWVAGGPGKEADALWDASIKASQEDAATGVTGRKSGYQGAEKAMDDLARSRMTSEQKIADLKREQAQQAAAANDNSKSELERKEAEKRVLELQQKIEEAQNKVDQKEAEAAVALEAEMLDLARSRMTAEQKIADLKREQAQLAALANDKSRTDLERMEDAKRVLELQQEIEAGQKKIDKDKEDEAEKVAQQAKKAAEDIANAEGKVAEEEHRQYLDSLKPKDRIEALKKKQKLLFDEAENMKTADPKASAEKKLEALKINDDIAAAKKELEEQKKEQGAKPTMVSSSLAAIGGGGGTYVAAGADPALMESRRQTGLLQQIARNTSSGGGGNNISKGSQLF